MKCGEMMLLKLDMLPQRSKMDNSMSLITQRTFTVSMLKPGKSLWQHSIGTVGKGSPVWVDGKLYVTEVNGKFHILQPSADKCESLNVQEISREEDDHYVEIYGSPAIADGRIYFTTEERIYCIGGK